MLGPLEAFFQLNWLTSVVGLASGIALLWFCSEIVMRQLNPIARFFGVKELVITILGISVLSSLPELTVSAFAAINGQSDISVGNIIGSNFVTLTFVTALCVLIAPMKISLEIRERESIWMTLSTAIILVLALDGVLSRLDGVILILLYIPYLFSVIKNAKSEAKVSKTVVKEVTKTVTKVASKMATKSKTKSQTSKTTALKTHQALKTKKESPEPQANPEGKKIVFHILFCVLAIFGIILGANITLVSGETIGLLAGIPPLALGVLIFAFGTSLPELAVALAATFKHKAEISIGEVYASNIFTALCILGICCLITPLQISQDIIKFDLPFLILVGIVIQIFITTQSKLIRLEAIAIMIFYIYFVVRHFVPIPFLF